MSVSISRLRFENHREALGIAEGRPRLSWSFTGDAKNWLQESYEVEIHYADSAAQKSSPQVYSVKSCEAVYVNWPGRDLSSGESARVRVRAFEKGTLLCTPWSEEKTVEVGLQDTDGWAGSSIIESPESPPIGIKRPVRFCRIFTVSREVAKARLYVTSHGVYEAEINSSRVGDHVLGPGWTNYDSRLIYQTFDIKEYLQNGSNVIGATVSEGWYCGRLGFNGGQRDLWGSKVGLIAKIVITYVDGSCESFGTDKGWKCRSSSVLSSEIYDGEVFDSRIQDSWLSSKPSIEDNNWIEVVTSTLPPEVQMASPDGPPVRRTETVEATSILKSPSGKTIIDFGQNLVGWLRVRVPAQTSDGHTIKFTHTEVLENGECATRPLRFAAATDSLILSSNSLLQTWEPKFTFHGFRYVEVANWPEVEPLQLHHITAVVVHTDMERTGWFRCSDALVNRLHLNVVWSMKGNFLSVPTDCPQRDERLGWTGDIAMFAKTANFLFDTSGMLTGWLRDLESEQTPEGVPPLVCPNVLSASPSKPIAIWGDCMVTLPWNLYEAFGSLDLLSQKYKSMQAWLDKGIPRDGQGLWDPSAWQLGDWLDAEAPATEPGNGSTEPLLVANACLIQTVDIMQQVSSLIGNSGDSKRYAAEATKLRKAFAANYITERGRVVADTQTALALAIHFSLFSTIEQENFAAVRLEQIIRDKYRFKIGTGFVGTTILGHALTKVGKTQLFYRMLLHKKCPSFLYPVTMSATTIWERWNSMLPDGTINEGEMTSFNHYSLGAVADWLHAVVGGLKPARPGWKEIIVEPIPGGHITWANAKHLTPYGVAEVSWNLSGGEATSQGTFRLTATIPPNTTALVRLPGRSESISVGSGTYEFEIEYSKPEWPPIPNYPPYFPHEDDEP